MKFASVATRQRDSRSAALRLVEKIKRQLDDGMDPDLVLFFATREHLRATDRIVDTLHEAWPLAVVMGTTAQGVLHPSCTPYNRPALAALAASLPGVTMAPVRMGLEDFEQAPLGLEKWQEMLEAVPDPRIILLLADPFTAPIAELLDTLNTVAPGVPVAGGTASGARRPGGHILVLDDTQHRSGAVGVALAGELVAETVVSQGYAPIGQPFRVTKAEGNVLLELNGMPALEALQEVVSTLSSKQKSMLRGGGLMVGEALIEPTEDFGRGDFLIRPVVGVDQDDGAIAVAGLVDEGRTVRFQVWDDTLSDDLELLLLPQLADTRAAGGLIFGSWPREKRRAKPGLSVARIRKTLGYDLPIAGTFSAGEIGPIRGVNYIHTHTAALTLFRPPGED
jgi:small ligand-binding sensory domain FIST